MLRIKLVKSTIGNTARNRATVQALGLRKLHQVIEHDDTPTIRGMVHRVKHLLSVEESEGTKTRAKAAPKAARTTSEPKPAKVKAAKPAKVAKADTSKPKAKKEVAKPVAKVTAKPAEKPAAKPAAKAEKAPAKAAAKPKAAPKGDKK
ncbi:MAG TPA: 50S ribosomal protein L30 [Fimbriimonadaceae bacterium]|jgi:ribosomal protein L30